MGWIADRIAGAMQKPDTRPLDEWCEEMIRFPGSPISERFDRANVPMLIEPLRAWDNPLIRAVSVLAGVQGGKTGLEQIAVARAIWGDPGNVLVTAQTDNEATFYARTKLLPCLRASPATRNRIAQLGRDDVTKEHILLGSMFVQIQGPSLSGAQSKTIWKLINDEMWRWDKGTMEELLRRTNAVRNRKILSVSQGGEQIENDDGKPDWDEWGMWWHQGTQEMFEVRCPGCEQFFGPETRIHPKGKYIICWDDTPDTRHPDTKEWNWQAVRQTVRMQCPHCDRLIENRERDRRALVQDWRYTVTNDNPSPAHRSFRYSGWTLWWRDWADMVESLLRAQDALTRGDIEPLKIFTQKEEARFWMLADAEMPIVNTKTASGYRIETYEPQPEQPVPRIPDEERRFAWFDMQRDCFPGIIRAFGGGKSRLLFCEEVQHAEEIKDIEKQYGLQSAAVGLDIGNWSQEAKKLCLLHGWTPTRGRDVRNFTKTRGRRQAVITRFQSVPERLTGDAMFFKPPYGKPGVGATLKVWEFANTYFKDLFSRLRRMPEHEIPDDISQAYIESMESERKDGKTGLWKQVGKRPNHFWDCEVAITFFAHLYNLVGEKREENESKSDE